MTSTLPVAATTVVRAPASERNCTRSPGKVACGGAPLVLATALPDGTVSGGGAFPDVLVDDGSGVDVLFGRPEPAAAEALRAGRAVVTVPAAVVNGTVSLGVLDDTATERTDPNGNPPIAGEPIVLKATLVTDGFHGATVIVPPSAVAKYGTPEVIGVLASTTRLPTDREQQAARGALQALDPDAYVQVETGYHNPSQWVLYLLIGVAAVIALGAASIATALANTDGREDLVTLGAVGASPRTRRVMSMSRAGVIAGLGCAIGVAAGFVPAFAWVRGDRATQAGDAKIFGLGGRPEVALHFVVPWAPILLALFGIPLIAAVLAGLVTRSRLPSERARV
jgi:putative ABC transport system permease protein